MRETLSSIVDRFQHDGFVVLPRIVPDDDVRHARRSTYEMSLRQSGWRSHRKLHVENVLKGAGVVDAVVNNPSVLEIASSLLNDIALYGARFRAPLPGYGEQVLHVDEEDDYEGDLRLLTVITPLDAFRSESGATRVIGGSHIQPPSEVPIDPLTPVPGQVTLSADPGDVVILSGQLWHSGTRNTTSEPRGALSASFVRRGCGL